MHPSLGLPVGPWRSPPVAEHSGQPRGLAVRGTAGVAQSGISCPTRISPPSTPVPRATTGAADTAVMAGPVTPCGDRVQWPGGKELQVPWAASHSRGTHLFGRGSLRIL